VYWLVRERKQNRHTHKGEQDKLGDEFAKIQWDIALKIHTLNNNYQYLDHLLFAFFLMIKSRETKKEKGGGDFFFFR